LSGEYTVLKFWHKIRRNLHPRLEGRQIGLRPLDEADLDLLYRWFKEPKLVSQAFGVIADNVSLDEMAREFLESLFSGHKEALAIEDGLGDLIGFITYVMASEQGLAAKIGILIGREEDRGKGYGTDAMLTLLTFLFTERQVQRCELDTASFNHRAQRCFEKCGFVSSGRLIDIPGRGMEPAERIWMYLTREDFIGKFPQLG